MLPNLRTSLMLASMVVACAPPDDQASPTQTPTPVAGSPAERQILFVGTESSGRSSLYATNESGSSLEELTLRAGALSDEEYIVPTADFTPWPVPSPDGTRILFAVEKYNDVSGVPNRTLRQLEVNNSTFRSITPPPGRLTRVNWSPDGSKLVLEVRSAESGRSELFLLSEGDEAPQKVSDEQLSLLGFFPTGHQALVLERRESNQTLSVLDLDTREISRLSTPITFDVSNVKITHSGEMVLFQGWSSEMGCSELYRLDVGTSPREPVSLNLSTAVWSFLQGEQVPDPDETPPPPPPTPPSQEQPDDDGDTPGEMVWSCVPVSAPVPSPGDDLTLSFLAATEPNSNRTDVFTTRLDGKVVTPLTRDLAGENCSGATEVPRWSPDGKQLLVTFAVNDADMSGPEQLFLALPSQANALRVIPTPAGTRPTMSQWSSDGERLLFWASALSRSPESPAGQLMVVDPVTAVGTELVIPSDITLSSPLYLDHNTLLY